MVSQIYPSKLQLNKANMYDTKSAFLDLRFPISCGIVSTKIYNSHYLDFENVNILFLDGSVPRYTTFGVYISLKSSHLLMQLAMLLTSTLTIKKTQEPLKQGYQYHKLFLNCIFHTLI